MNRPGPASKFATAFAAASLLLSSAASAAPIRAADHVVSASLISASAQTAVCATGTAATAGAAAAGQAAPAQPGCVLPMVDAAPAPVAEAPPAPVYVPPAERGGFGIGVIPILLGLAALVWVLHGGHDDDEDAPPADVPLTRA